MHLHKFDTPTKNAHLHAWRAQPATPDEWLEHWNNEGGIWIPCTEGNRPVFTCAGFETPVIALHYLHQIGEGTASLYAHNRFFFWWISASLPLTVIAWGVWVESWISRRAASLVVVALAIALMWPKPAYRDLFPSYFELWNYQALYERDARNTMWRVNADIQNSEMGKSSTLVVSLHTKDAREIYRRARWLGATFVDRHGLLDEPIRTNR